ncbi:citrate lyase beta subunit [Sphingomonas sp. PP-CC-3G-468]|nr:citrate lyase beta subunit [Sphingomonas sp. PP-CC-3G-468]
MSMRALALGATLYMPCTRTDLAARLFGPLRIPGLRSVVLCLEDAVLERDLPVALTNLSRLLRSAAARERGTSGPMVFVRPRDPAMLARILRMPGVGSLTGYVLPKANAESLPCYLGLPIPEGQLLMPTLETREACDPYEMRRLRDQLLAVHDRILALRIGGNDLMQTMGLRRSPGSTAYDGPLGAVIAMLVATFSPWGFALSAPVMERFGDTQLLRREVARDIDHGLLTKTAIHPEQIPIIQNALAVPAFELDEARLILDPTGPAVFAQSGVMCEPATHRVWAERLIARADVYGTIGAVPLHQRA